MDWRRVLHCWLSPAVKIWLIRSHRKGDALMWDGWYPVPCRRCIRHETMSDLLWVRRVTRNWNASMREEPLVIFSISLGISSPVPPRLVSTTYHDPWLKLLQLSAYITKSWALSFQSCAVKAVVCNRWVTGRTLKSFGWTSEGSCKSS